MYKPIKLNDMKIVKSSRNDDKFLIIEDVETLVMMVMLKQIPIYWLQPDYSDLNCVTGGIIVTNPQTIYGASPNMFGIRLPKSKFFKSEEESK